MQKKNFLETISQKVTYFFASFTVNESRQIGFDTRLNPWENPPEPTEAMKVSIELNKRMTKDKCGNSYL